MSETALDATPVPTPETNGTAKKPPRRPPPRLSFASVDHNNIGTLRKLNSVIFPIVYTERFYADTLVAEHADYCKLGSCKTRRQISVLLLKFSIYLKCTTMTYLLALFVHVLKKVQRRESRGSTL